MKSMAFLSKKVNDENFLESFAKKANTKALELNLKPKKVFEDKKLKNIICSRKQEIVKSNNSTNLKSLASELPSLSESQGPTSIKPVWNSTHSDTKSINTFPKINKVLLPNSKKITKVELQSSKTNNKFHFSQKPFADVTNKQNDCGLKPEVSNMNHKTSNNKEYKLNNKPDSASIAYKQESNSSTMNSPTSNLAQAIATPTPLFIINNSDDKLDKEFLSPQFKALINEPPKHTGNYIKLEYKSITDNSKYNFYCYKDEDLAFEKDYANKIIPHRIDNDCHTDDEQINISIKNLYLSLRFACEGILYP